MDSFVFVSVSVQELVALAYETLHETTTGCATAQAPPTPQAPAAGAVKPSAAPKTSKQSNVRATKSTAPTKGDGTTLGGTDVRLLTPQCAIQLFYTVRNMFELYISIVPVYHRERLVSLPLFAGLIVTFKECSLKISLYQII